MRYRTIDLLVSLGRLEPWAFHKGPPGVEELVAMHGAAPSFVERFARPGLGRDWYVQALAFAYATDAVADRAVMAEVLGPTTLPVLIDRFATAAGELERARHAFTEWLVAYEELRDVVKGGSWFEPENRQGLRLAPAVFTWMTPQDFYQSFLRAPSADQRGPVESHFVAELASALLQYAEVCVKLADISPFYERLCKSLISNTGVDRDSVLLAARVTRMLNAKLASPYLAEREIQPERLILYLIDDDGARVGLHTVESAPE